LDVTAEYSHGGGMQDGPKSKQLYRIISVSY